MKLNYRRTALIGFAFFGILLIILGLGRRRAAREDEA